MQKLIAVVVGLLFSFLLPAQQKTTDTSYTLLWYKGKKIKPNVLLTPGKDTVRYDPAKSIVKRSSKTGHGNQLDKMLAELDKTPQRMNEMISKVKAGMPKTVQPYYATIIRESYTHVQREFSPALSNTLEIPATVFAEPAAIATGHGPSPIDYEPGEQTFDEAMQEVLGYYEQHKNEKITFVPTPPRRELNYCSMKDKNLDAAWDRDFEQFRSALAGRDEAIFRLSLKLYHHAEVLLDDAGRLDTDKKLAPVTAMLLQRQHDKALLLVNQFGDDPYRCWAVFKITLLIERQLALVGWYDDHAGEPFTVWLIMQKALHAWAALFEKAMQEYDYSIALNIQAILSMERMAQLHNLDQKMPVNKLLQFNRFKLDMHVSSKLSVNGGYQLAELKGDNWFCALPDSTGRLVWILIGPLVNKVSMQLTAAEYRGKIDFPYIGTRQWETQLPKMKLDFCGQQKDTLDVYMFHAAGFKETWVFPKPQGAIDIIIVPGILSSTFMDVERIKKTRDELKADPAAIEKMKKEMLAKLEQMKKTGSLTPVANNGAMNMNRLAAMAEIQKMSNEMRQHSKQYDLFKFVFSPKPQNRTRLVLQEKLNGKELFPQNAATEYAWFHLKLEQDPNCPFEIYL